MSFHVGKTSILSTLDYIEDGRADIYAWSEKRRSKRTGISGKLYQIKKLFINKTVLRSFVQNLTIIVVLQMVLAALGTFICQKFGLDFDVHMSIFVSPIVFPLAFSINADFQRRERVLEDLAQFKGALVILFFCHRDWIQASGLPTDFLKTVNHKLKGLVLNIKEYLLTEKVQRRSYILAVIYEDLSDISQLNDKMRASSLPHNSPLITRLIHYHNLMCHAFEMLRVIREYRSPRTIRSFTKVFIFLMPIVLSPYYVHMGIKSGNIWSPYYIAVLSSFMYGTLQGVQDVLDDPFDGISEDDINLGQLEDWTAHSLLTNRTITVGRFTVTTKANGKDAKQLDSDSDSDGRSGPKPKVIQPAKAPQKRKPILRKPSFRRVDHGEEIQEPQKTLYPETAHRLEDLARHGMTGCTTILPGMKLKRSNSDSLTASSSRTSLAQELVRAQGVDGSGRDSREFKRVWFSKETQGLSDDHGDFDSEDDAFVSRYSHSAPSDFSRPEWMLDENAPLIASDSRSVSQRSSCTGTSSVDTSEVDPQTELPEELCEGLKNSPGTSLINGRFSVDKKNGDVPPSLANLFGGQLDRPLDETDGSSPQSTKQQPDYMPSYLKNLFSPLENQDKNLPSYSSVSSPPGNTPRPRVLPISPLARTDCPANTRRHLPYVPVSRISRSAPTSPEQGRKWDTFRGISDPLTPSPEEAVSIPLASATPQRSADYPLRKTSASRRFGVDTSEQVAPVHDSAQVASASLSPADKKKSGDSSAENSRFAVKSPAHSPAIQSLTEHSTSPSKGKNPSGNARGGAPETRTAEDIEPSKVIDVPNSRFSVAKPSADTTSPQREDQPLVTTEFPNYGVTDPSPPQRVLTTPPSRFQVNSPKKISQDSEQDREDEDVSRRDSFELLTLDGESTEVFI